MKKVVLLVIIAGLCFLGYFLETNKKKDLDSNLENDKEENSKIEEKVDKKDVDKVLSLGDKEVINNMINDKEFDNKKVDDYVDFYKENEDVDINDVIKLVNNDIDKIDGFEYDDIIVSLVDEDYYIYDNTIRYIKYYKQNNNLSAPEIVTNVNSNIDYDFYTNTIETDLSKGNLVLVNKYNYLDSDYEPEDLVPIRSGYTSWGGYLTEETNNAFEKMANAAYEDGYDLYSVSPYRSYSTQKSLYNRYASRDGVEEADTYSARAGFSEHQTGLAIDINSTDDSFAYTSEAKWLEKNAHKYGFILRYPKGKEYLTGYQYEPWHYRYVGEDVAQKVYDLDITWEEYYAYYVDKK